MIIKSIIENNHSSKTGIWLMRQAGRYLPEYKKERKKHGTFLDLVFTPKSVVKVTLQPMERFDFDAAIIFSDILVVPYALGQNVSFEEGVQLSPLKLEKIFSIKKEAFLNALTPVFEAVSLCRKTLDSEKALIGFSGCPFTLACYMLGGKSQDSFLTSRVFGYKNPEKMKKLLDFLSIFCSYYLIRQAQAGADLLQLFESWGGLVPWDKKEDWLYSPVRKILKEVRKHCPSIPVVVFSKGVSDLQSYQKEVKPSALSLDSGQALTKGNWNLPVQGNLDPALLLAGGEEFERSVLRIKDYASQEPLVFNLGHGILPQTPIEHVKELVKLVRKSA